MGILFWYIARHYLKILTLCLVGLITIYMVVDFFEQVRRFLGYDAELSSLFMYFFFRIPEVTYTVAPLAMLMASLLSIGLLNKNQEINAMRKLRGQSSVRDNAVCGGRKSRHRRPVLAHGGRRAPGQRQGGIH